MQSLDLDVLEQATKWRRAGHEVSLITVVETFGSAPRPPGALLAVRNDAVVAGSVSGGCVEDDLIDRVRHGERIAKPQLITYGVTREEAARFGLPCGGTLRLIQEPLTDYAWAETVIAEASEHKLVARTLDLDTGRVTLGPTTRESEVTFDGKVLVQPFGPRWRLLIIGASQVSQLVAEFAIPLGYEVLVCDPREEYTTVWNFHGAKLLTGMPDDVVNEIGVDAHTAVVALTHDPKLDDMALIEALKSDAFYIGALGSRANSSKRRKRLEEFDLSAEEIAKLRGPIGLHIGSRTPAEIAISLMAEVTAVRNGVAVTQVKDQQVVPANACAAT